jgi:putative tricarboxylic transport membrane protein
MDLRRRLWVDAAGRRDLLLALAVILLALVVYWQASLLPPPFFDPVGSAAVPKFVALLLALLAVGVIVERLRAKPGAVEAGFAPEVVDDDPAEPAPWTALASIVLPVLYVAVMQAGWLAFAQASTLFVLALGALFGRFRPRLLLLLVPVAFLAGYGLDYIFTEILYVDLPQRSLLGGS